MTQKNSGFEGPDGNALTREIVETVAGEFKAQNIWRGPLKEAFKDKENKPEDKELLKALSVLLPGTELPTELPAEDLFLSLEKAGLVLTVTADEIENNQSFVNIIESETGALDSRKKDLENLKAAIHDAEIQFLDKETLAHSGWKNALSLGLNYVFRAPGMKQADKEVAWLEGQRDQTQKKVTTLTAFAAGKQALEDRILPYQGVDGIFAALTPLGMKALLDLQSSEIKNEQVEEFNMAAIDRTSEAVLGVMSEIDMPFFSETASIPEEKSEPAEAPLTEKKTDNQTLLEVNGKNVDDLGLRRLFESLLAEDTEEQAATVEEINDGLSPIVARQLCFEIIEDYLEKEDGKSAEQLLFECSGVLETETLLEKYREILGLLLEGNNFEEAKESLDNRESEVPEKWAGEQAFLIMESMIEGNNFSFLNEMLEWYPEQLKSAEKLDDAIKAIVQAYLNNDETEKAETALIEAKGEASESVIEELYAETLKDMDVTDAGDSLFNHYSNFSDKFVGEQVALLIERLVEDKKWSELKDLLDDFSKEMKTAKKLEDTISAVVNNAIHNDSPDEAEKCLFKVAENISKESLEREYSSILMDRRESYPTSSAMASLYEYSVNCSNEFVGREVAILIEGFIENKSWDDVQEAFDNYESELRDADKLNDLACKASIAAAKDMKAQYGEKWHNLIS